MLAVARPGSAAYQAGVQRADTTTLVVIRGDARLDLEITYDQGRSR